MPRLSPPAQAPSGNSIFAVYRSTHNHLEEHSTGYSVYTQAPIWSAKSSFRTPRLPHRFDGFERHRCPGRHRIRIAEEEVEVQTRANSSAVRHEQVVLAVG